MLFRNTHEHDGNALSDRAMSQPDARRTISRRAADNDMMAPIGCHTFRATGITAYLANGSALGTRRKWPRMRARAPLSSTTGGRSGSPGTRSKGSDCEG
jgi:hypothetical protein